MDVETHNLAKEPPSRELLEKLIDEEDLDAYLNPRSTPYRELGLKNEKISKKKAIDLILEDPNLLRRPLVVKGRKAVFGWKPDEYEKLV